MHAPLVQLKAEHFPAKLASLVKQGECEQVGLRGQGLEVE